MQITSAYPPPEAYEEQGRGERLMVEQRFRERAVAVKKATLDYHTKVRDEQARAALAMVETVMGEPETGQEWADAPIPLVKLAAVEGSGISVNGARLLADECWKRAAVLEPGRFGKGDGGAGSGFEGQVASALALLIAKEAGIRGLAVDERPPIEHQP